MAERSETESPMTPVTAMTPGTPEATLAYLAGLPGMDVKRGLAAFLGKTGNYLEFLGRLVATHRDDMSRLEECLAGGDREAARRMAHTLKGTAATLGADALSVTAASLEARLKAGVTDALISQALAPEMAAVQAALLALALNP